MKKKSFGEQVRRDVKRRYPEVENSDRIHIRPHDSAPTEYGCTVTFGQLQFSMFGKLTNKLTRTKLTPQQVADETVLRLRLRADREKEKVEAEDKRTYWEKEKDKAQIETPGAEGTALLAIPALDVLGDCELHIGELYVDDHYSPHQLRFSIRGSFDVAAVKQLLAGTEFRMRLRKG